MSEVVDIDFTQMRAAMAPVQREPRPVAGTPILPSTGASGTDARQPASPSPQPESPAPAAGKPARAPARPARTQARTSQQPAVARKAPPAEPTPGADEPVNAAVWIPKAVRERLDADLGDEGLTISERVVQAFNSQYARLPELLPTRRPAEGPMPVSRSMSRRKRGTATDTVLMKLRLTPSQMTVMEDAVEQYATNRSLLVTRVLEADLPPLTAEPAVDERPAGT